MALDWRWAHRIYDVFAEHWWEPVIELGFMPRDLSAKGYVNFCVVGIYLETRLEDLAQCILVIIGSTPEGKMRSTPSACNF